MVTGSVSGWRQPGRSPKIPHVRGASNSRGRLIGGALMSSSSVGVGRRAEQGVHHLGVVEIVKEDRKPGEVVGLSQA